MQVGVAKYPKKGGGFYTVPYGTPGMWDVRGYIGHGNYLLADRSGMPVVPAIPFEMEVKWGDDELSAVQIDWRDNVLFKRGVPHREVYAKTPDQFVTSCELAVHWLHQVEATYGRGR